MNESVNPTFAQDTKIAYQPGPLDNILTKHMTWDNFNKSAMMGIGATLLLIFPLTNLFTAQPLADWEALLLLQTNGLSMLTDNIVDEIAATTAKIAFINQLQTIGYGCLVLGSALFAGGWSRK